MRVSLFPERSKFDLDFRNPVKNSEKSFLFLRKLHLNWYRKFSLLRREDLFSAVNVLTNSPKNSDITKRDILQLSFPRSY